MSRPTGSHEAAKPGGLFDRLGDFVIRRPLVVIASWIIFAGALALIFPPLPVQAAKQEQKPLPDDAPTMVAGREMQKAFHEAGGGSQALIILTDEKGLTPADE
ncbi:hypothetical protein, partial [Mycobacterium sp. Lab-001]|uniref:hypothetical protein n=1 Tax=Mycobacterium sp. Lab-001 TaxID=3410136 RepID=UPI003D16A7B1